ncbi:hypothetical protein CO683_24560 [Bradyrhizobium ottawaense]|nr:hypothetical protein [Bradyrhizobium sp. CCBAU 45394]PDT67102.1 hypothetical protein CO683_24560 [Bradyrhizobium ottawaense]
MTDGFKATDRAKRRARSSRQGRERSLKPRLTRVWPWDVERRQALDIAVASVARAADPQTEAATKLIASLSRGTCPCGTSTRLVMLQLRNEGYSGRLQANLKQEKTTARSCTFVRIDGCRLRAAGAGPVERAEQGPARALDRGIRRRRCGIWRRRQLASRDQRSRGIEQPEFG